MTIHHLIASRDGRRIGSGLARAVWLLGVLAFIAGASGCTAAARANSFPDAPAKLSVALTTRGDSIPSISVASPASGATVESPVLLRVKFEYLTPAAAGATVDGEGHLHVLIDQPCLPTGLPIPKDASHVHFGDGSTDLEVELEPGEHELCVQMGDGFHTAVAITDTLTVNVAP